MPAWRPPGLTWLIVASLIALIPLAHASPPDPTWLWGVWDDADHDNVVILATSDGGIADIGWSGGPRVLRVPLGGVVDAARGLLATPPLAFDRPRGPPAA